jgi:type II secretory pathway component GspD/PulD (secretin)
MLSDKRVTGWWRRFVSICAITSLLAVSYEIHGQQGNGSKLPRYRVYRLRYITGEKGKQYLTDARVGTVSQIPAGNTLLVTADQRDLIKASSIIKLVDSEQEYAIRAILPASEAANLPSAKDLAAKVGGIFIGTFTDPPGAVKGDKVIIDTHNESVFVIAPAYRIDEIVSVVEQMRQTGAAVVKKPSEAKPAEEVKAEAKPAEEVKAEEAKPAEVVKAEPVEKEAPAEVAEKPQVEVNEPDELFSRLIDSLAKAEKKAKEARIEAEAQKAVEARLIEEARKAAKAREEEIKKRDEKPVEAAKEEKKVEEAKPAEEKPEVAEEPEAEKKVEAERPAEVVTYEPETVPTGDEMLELDLPEKLNIVDLIDLVGKYLKLDYLYDETKVTGQVTLKVQGPIKVRDLYPLLESVLKFKGFVMARKLNLVTIVPAVEALDVDPALLTNGKKVELGDVVVTRVFELEHIDTTSATNLLTEMRLGVNITPIADTKTLIVTGYAYLMGRIEELLTMIDKPGEPRQFRFRQLKYTMATTLAPKVKTLVEQLGEITITVAAGAQPAQAPPRGRRAPAQPAPPPAAGGAGKPAVYLDADDRTNRILMVGFKGELDTVEELIGALDVEQQDLRMLRIYDIQYVGADEVLKKLQELGIVGGVARTGAAPGRITGPPAAAGAQPPAAPTVRPPAAGGESAEPLAGEPQVIVVDSTNSLLVNATAEQHMQIAIIIGYVDSETLQQAIPYEIYSLENQNPEDLAEVLQKLIQETIMDKEGKIQQTIKKIEEDIVIVPDKATFSLIVYASRKNQEWIRSLIKTLDRRRPQVLIDVTLVEVRRSDLFDMDLQLASKWPKMNTPKPDTDSNMSVVGAIVQPFVGGTAELFSSPVAGTAEGFYSDAHIQVLLTAIQTKSYGRVLAKPKILVNDGQPGTIKTTETTNIQIETLAPGGPTSNPISTTTFQPYTAGITLTITPNISEGELLLLEVEMIRSDFVPRTETTIPPDSTETNINTVVTVPDGKTIILGGLVKLDQSKGHSKVPILGDIPLIGGIFRSISDEAVDSKLYIFVRANILRPDEAYTGLSELEVISQKSRDAFEDFEDKFQKAQDWPGIKPKPVEPLHVLETE